MNKKMKNEYSLFFVHTEVQIILKSIHFINQYWDSTRMLSLVAIASFMFDVIKISINSENAIDNL